MKKDTVAIASAIKSKGSSTTTNVKDALLKDLPELSSLWHGFAVEPAHGNWDITRNFIQTIICDNSPESFEYLWGWMALMAQKPDSAGQVALFLKGKGHTSRGMFIQCLCDLMGQHVCHETDLKEVTEKFNDHLKDCVLLILDGAFYTGGKRSASVLKTLISEPCVAIEQKGEDVQIIPNKLHVVLSGCNDGVLQGLDASRRWVLNVSDACQHDHAYFSAIANEMANGGLSAMLQALLLFDLDGFDARNIPQTQG